MFGQTPSAILAVITLIGLISLATLLGLHTASAIRHTLGIEKSHD